QLRRRKGLHLIDGECLYLRNVKGIYLCGAEPGEFLRWNRRDLINGITSVRMSRCEKRGDLIICRSVTKTAELLVTPPLYLFWIEIRYLDLGKVFDMGLRKAFHLIFPKVLQVAIRSGR